MATLTLDIECYQNYYLASLLDVETGQVYEFRLYNDKPEHDRNDLYQLLVNNTIITFNGLNYDLPITTLYLCGASNIELKRASDDIIKNSLMPWNFERKYNVQILQLDHVDLIQIAPGVASLKMYGARMGIEKLQELPLDPNTVIMPSQVDLMDRYCRNDNAVTKELYLQLKEAIDLRVKMSGEYGIDLKSKSDAQIAEQVIKSEYQKLRGTDLPKPMSESSYKYIPPAFVSFVTEPFNELLKLTREVDFNISSKGAVLLPKALNKQITVRDKSFKMGIGGLHSIDKPGSYYTTDEYKLMDIDVTSYYPNVILNGGFEPPHIGSLFSTIYRNILDRRIAAKKKMKNIKSQLRETPGDTNLISELKKQDSIQASLKITINGLFGKFGNRYSKVYAPDLMFHTTVTGQLCLFMLIEQFEMLNIKVISANTDGIVLLVNKDLIPALKHAVHVWENFTNLNMEYTYYQSIHYRDVNNYFAITTDGSVKGKGIFTSTNLNKNPAFEIIPMAAMTYFSKGIDPSVTINSCTEIKNFLQVKKVAGGATKDNKYVGKTVRWYRSTVTDTALYYAQLNKTKTSYNKVGDSDCGMPLMDLPEQGLIPADVDKAWYIKQAQELIEQIGVDCGRAF